MSLYRVYNKLKQFPVITRLILNDNNKMFNVDTKKISVETAVSLLDDRVCLSVCLSNKFGTKLGHLEALNKL